MRDRRSVIALNLLAVLLCLVGAFSYYPAVSWLNLFFASVNGYLALYNYGKMAEEREDGFP